MPLDPLSLRLFIAVVEQGSIAAAAQANHIAAAAVSKRISELEVALKTALLSRTNRGVAPTPAGVELARASRRLLAEFDNVAAQMHEWSGTLRGRVRIYANISAIMQFLPKEIAAFTARCPGVDLQLVEGISTEIVKAVRENQADVGVCVLDAPVDGIEALDYHEDRLTLIAPRGHPVLRRRQFGFAQAGDLDFVGLHQGSSINRLLERASLARGRSMRFRIHVTSYDALARMVEAGLGVGVMPEAVASSLSRSMAIGSVAIKDAWAHRRLSLVVRAYAALPEASRALVDTLRHPGKP